VTLTIFWDSGSLKRAGGGVEFFRKFWDFLERSQKSEEGKLHPPAPRSEAIQLSLSRHASRQRNSTKFGS
jgi:hypothetical protein